MPNQLSVSKTAVLLFNSTVKQQASVLQIAPNMPVKKVASLLSVLNTRASALAKKTKLPLFQVEIDRKLDFGTQTFEAYQKLFDLGFQSVVGISNDCPTLEVDDILVAAKSLKTRQVVLGPAKDGGLYLFGLRKDQFSQQEFTALNWQTKSLCAEVIDTCGSKSIAVLTAKSDMDTVADILTVFRSKFDYLTDFFKQIFSFAKRIIREQFEIRVSVSLISLPLRAPPY